MVLRRKGCLSRSSEVSFGWDGLFGSAGDVGVSSSRAPHGRAELAPVEPPSYEGGDRNRFLGVLLVGDCCGAAGREERQRVIPIRNHKHAIARGFLSGRTRPANTKYLQSLLRLVEQPLSYCSRARAARSSVRTRRAAGPLRMRERNANRRQGSAANSER